MPASSEPLVQAFHQEVEDLLARLRAYPPAARTAQPAPGEWSAAQVASHLHSSALTDSFPAVERALADTAHADAEPTPAGRAILAKGAFPDMKIERPAELAANQPANTADLAAHEAALRQVQQAFQEAEAAVAKRGPGGRARHPGLGYLTAAEWLHFTLLHFRHHRRQLDRIHAHLQTAGYLG